MNTGFESFLGTATMMSAWSTEYGALPAFLVAAVLAPEDRADFLRSYVLSCCVQLYCDVVVVSHTQTSLPHTNTTPETKPQNSLARVSFAPPPQAASLVVKGRLT